MAAACGRVRRGAAVRTDTVNVSAERTAEHRGASLSIGRPRHSTVTKSRHEIIMYNRPRGLFQKHQKSLESRVHQNPSDRQTRCGVILLVAARGCWIDDQVRLLTASASAFKSPSRAGGGRGGKAGSEGTAGKLALPPSPHDTVFADVAPLPPAILIACPGFVVTESDRVPAASLPGGGGGGGSATPGDCCSANPGAVLAVVMVGAQVDVLPAPARE